MNKLIKTKFSSWVYEEEFRFGCTLSDCIPDEGMYFEKFGSELILKEVITGCKFNHSGNDKKLLNSLVGGFENIKVIEARMDSDRYQIVPHYQKS